MTIPSRLVDGYRAFREHRLPIERSRYEKLAETGQQPDTMVIGCCDSRVSPEVIFDAHPGELFVVRNVANLVPPYAPTGMTHGVAAALEFAVEILKVKHIIVLGHTRCGGIRAFVEHKGRRDPRDFIDNWMSLVELAASSVPTCESNDHYIGRLEQASILTTMRNLVTFPRIEERVRDRRLAIVGAYFDVATGTLAVHDPDTNSFKPIVELACTAVAEGRLA